MIGGVQSFYVTLSGNVVAQLIEPTVVIVIIPFGLLEQRNGIVFMKTKARGFLES